MPHEFAQHTPTNLIILGATGDLVKRKIVPALYSLYKRGLLPKLFNVIGFSRRDWGDEEFKAHIKSILTKGVEDEFLNLFHYQKGDFTEMTAYTELASLVGGVDTKWSVCSNKLFYLAVPPNFNEQIIINLEESGLSKPCSDDTGWARVIVEKPFGKDYVSAKKLDKLLSKLFKEEQIYRVDHYLGKEILQNILVFRFANNFLEQGWDGGLIEKN